MLIHVSACEAGPSHSLGKNEVSHRQVVRSKFSRDYYGILMEERLQDTARSGND